MERQPRPREKCCGCVVLHERSGVFRVLLVQSRKGRHWAFPKGHVEAGEDELATARREVREETGLTVTIRAGFRTATHYVTKKRTSKEVIYFLARADTDRVTPQPEEIAGFVWLRFEDALQRLTFPRDIRVLREAMAHLGGESEPDTTA